MSELKQLRDALIKKLDDDGANQAIMTLDFKDQPNRVMYVIVADVDAKIVQLIESEDE